MWAAGAGLGSRFCVRAAGLGGQNFPNRNIISTATVLLLLC